MPCPGPGSKKYMTRTEYFGMFIFGLDLSNAEVITFKTISNGNWILMWNEGIVSRYAVGVVAGGMS